MLLIPVKSKTSMSRILLSATSNREMAVIAGLGKNLIGSVELSIARRWRTNYNAELVTVQCTCCVIKKFIVTKGFTT